MSEEWKNGFEPVIDENCKLLVLGSFPSVKSRRAGFYYGNPQNRFWNTLEAALGEPVPKDTEGKKGYLLHHGVALWDVIEKSAIDGSMDNDLKKDNSVPAGIPALLAKYRNIENVILNGKKAMKVYSEYAKDISAKAVCLPSTSPANVSFNAEIWIKTIKEILKK